jgi:hypothetical protein
LNHSDSFKSNKNNLKAMRKLTNLTVEELKEKLNEARYLSLAFDLLQDIEVPTEENIKEKQELDRHIAELESKLYVL